MGGRHESMVNFPRNSPLNLLTPDKEFEYKKKVHVEWHRFRNGCCTR